MIYGEIVIMKNSRIDRTKEMYAKIGMLITSSLDIHEILEGIMTEVRLFFNPEHWSLLRLDEVTNELYFIFMEGADIDKFRQFRLKIGEGIAGTVAQTRQSIFVKDVKTDSRFSERADKIINFNTHSIIAVPIVYRDMVHGVIEIINPVNGECFSEDDHLILKTIADFSAIAMSNSSLYQKLMDQSSHDILTGLLNRKKLNELITRWSGESQLSRRSADDVIQLKVVYIDIDDFKQINDNYSHKEGDIALVRIASMLKGIFRNDDYIFRIGGDEFLAILIMREHDAEHMTRRIRKALDSLSFSSEDGKASLNVSYGISSGPSDSIESLINEADQMMYTHKRSKKNKS